MSDENTPDKKEMKAEESVEEPKAEMNASEQEAMPKKESKGIWGKIKGMFGKS